MHRHVRQELFVLSPCPRRVGTSPFREKTSAQIGPDGLASRVMRPTRITSVVRPVDGDEGVHGACQGLQAAALS